MAELGGECDFVNAVALHYPLRVIMEILGVPHDEEPRMLKLTHELFGATDPDLRRSEGPDTAEARAAEVQAVIADFFTYFNTITESRRANPVGDVASVIANATIDGQPISAFDAISYYVIIATAGHDTTSSSTAGGMWALAEHPGQLAKVKADLSLIPGLVDESIRWTTPVRHFMRCAAADTEVGGRSIAKGDWLMLCYPSGNRDEAVFENPFEFRVDRSPNKHLAFGYGAHLCLGQHLAKMEMRILWEELLPRLKSVSIAGDARLSEANFVNGPKQLPIRYELV
jgi:cytochrome P450